MVQPNQTTGSVSRESESELQERAVHALVGAGPDWQFNAAPDSGVLDVRWNSMSLSYKTAADLLVLACKATPHVTQTLLSPIFFNYRHSIELKLKCLIVLSSMHGKEGVADHSTHDLQALWRTVKKRASQYFASEEQLTSHDLSVAESYIAQLSEYDRDSTHFRYPVDKIGNDRKFSTRYINVVQMGTGIGVVFDVLERISHWFEHNLPTTKG